MATVEEECIIFQKNQHTKLNMSACQESITLVPQESITLVPQESITLVPQESITLVPQESITPVPQELEANTISKVHVVHLTRVDAITAVPQT